MGWLGKVYAIQHLIKDLRRATGTHTMGYLEILAVNSTTSKILETAKSELEKILVDNLGFGKEEDKGKLVKEIRYDGLAMKVSVDLTETYTETKTGDKIKYPMYTVTVYIEEATPKVAKYLTKKLNGKWYPEGITFVTKSYLNEVRKIANSEDIKKVASNIVNDTVEVVKYIINVAEEAAKNYNLRPITDTTT